MSHRFNAAFGSLLLAIVACGTGGNRAAQSAEPCANPVLIVHNNSDGSVEIVEYRDGRLDGLPAMVIAVVPTGTQTISVRGANARSYAARRPGSSETMASTDRAGRTNRVTLERRCAS